MPLHPIGSWGVQWGRTREGLCSCGWPSSALWFAQMLCSPLKVSILKVEFKAYLLTPRKKLSMKTKMTFFFNISVQALMDIKVSLKDPHGVLGNWDRDSVDPCSWSMVSCSPQTLVIGLWVFHSILVSKENSQFWFFSVVLKYKPVFFFLQGNSWPESIRNSFSELREPYKSWVCVGTL